MTIKCLSILIILTIATVFAHDKIHKTHDCIHDKIDHTISQQYVAYKNHPFNTKNTNKRKLLQSAQYESIRIRPYYDPLLINSNTLSMDKISYIKSLVSASILYLEQFVKVIPVQYPLLINRCQRLWNYDSFIYNVCPLSDYQTQLKCQYATIPDSHIAESWYYDPNTLQSFKYNEAGTGMVDADLVLYVSQSNGDCSSDGSTLAWASTCNLDQFGRPIAGTINFCPQALNTKYWKFDVGVTLHEIMHILVMSNSLFPYFYNLQSNEFYGEANVVAEQSITGLDNVYITTEKVKQISQNHFHCATLIGAPLENNGAVGTIGSHWEGKYLQSELMCGTMYSAVQYLSYFTLALMQDSGWYAVDYEYADYFTWGMGESCQFFNADCVSNDESNFEQYWCTDSADDGCSYDYSTVSECVNQKTGTIPTQFRYYTDPQFAGPESHDFCAFRIPETHSIYTDYEETCWDLRGNIYSATAQYQGVVFGANSRCVEVDYDDMKSGYCFQHECVGWRARNKYFSAVRIKINDGSIGDLEIITCLRNDAMSWKESKSYGAWIKCPNIDTICGKTSKPFNCFWGHYSDALNACICSVGYIGNDCSVKDINRLAIEASVATTVRSPQQSAAGICITNSISANVNGFYLYDGEYEGIASYTYDGSNINSHFIYYMRFYSQWNIGIFKADLSVYAYCTQSWPNNQMMTMDITDCKLWLTWDGINGWNYDNHINVFQCTNTFEPTSNPSITPTNIPTIEPTANPTKNPTINPTFNPTVEPSINPTNFPSDFPTEIPTINPSISPSNIPSSLPTLSPIILPTSQPTLEPTHKQSLHPTLEPTYVPTISPTYNPPTFDPAIFPTVSTSIPTIYPTYNPSFEPTKQPTIFPTIFPTVYPTVYPTLFPTFYPTHNGINTSPNSTTKPTDNPSVAPTYKPTMDDSMENTLIITLEINNLENAAIENYKKPNILSNADGAMLGGMIAFTAICVLLSCVILFICLYHCKGQRRRDSTINTIRIRSSSVEYNDNKTNAMDHEVQLIESNTINNVEDIQVECDELVSFSA